MIKKEWKIFPIFKDSINEIMELLNKKNLNKQVPLNYFFDKNNKNIMNLLINEMKIIKNEENDKKT